MQGSDILKNYECDNQLTIDAWLNPPAWKQPRNCGVCDCMMFSIECLEHLGCTYLNARRDWLRRRDGSVMIVSANADCHAFRENDPNSVIQQAAELKKGVAYERKQKR